MKIRRIPTVKVRLSGLCHTSQEDMEKIVNSAPIPAHMVPVEPRKGRRS